jgi:hypothetical protein
MAHSYRPIRKMRYGTSFTRLGRPTGGSIKLRQRQRRAQLKTLRLLLLRDGDSGEEGFLGQRGIGL